MLAKQLISVFYRRPWKLGDDNKNNRVFRNLLYYKQKRYVMLSIIYLKQNKFAVVSIHITYYILITYSTANWLSLSTCSIAIQKAVSILYDV